MSTRLADMRLTDAFMKGKNGSAWNPIYGGMMGYSRRLEQYLAAQPHVIRPVIAILMQAPKIFRYIEGGHIYEQTLKALIETQALTITGLNKSIEVETDQTPIGNAGAQFQVAVKSNRQQPTPEITWNDKDGRPGQHFWDFFIRYLIIDPDVMHPLAGIFKNNNITDIGVDFTTFSTLFMVPTALFDGIDKAWLCVNMFPTTTGEDSAEKNGQDSLKLVNLSIPFTAIGDSSLGTEQLAYDILMQMNVLDADPSMRRAIMDKIDPDVDKAAYQGYKQSMEINGTDNILKVRAT